MMRMVLGVLAVMVVMSGVACGQPGPGRGPWEHATPESQGLSTEELQTAADDVFEGLPNRVCYLVVKNGFIVHEQYYDGWETNSTRNGYSTTKSFCSSGYGIATQQGWADRNDRVADRNANTRQCNPDATFFNVLRMTGMSDDLDNPRFWYDAGGQRCLDTLSDFIEENNPEGLTAEEWMRTHWSDKLGMEHIQWRSSPSTGLLNCGSGAEVSCRDMARAAQLWVNEGEWEGEQLVARDHIVEGRQLPDNTVFPYGFNVWLDITRNDPVDPEYHMFVGANEQIAIVSKKHEAVVVSMGGPGTFGILAYRAWLASRDAIVSDNSTLPILG